MVGVGEIGPAVPVDVAERYVAVVRHDEGGIGAVHGDQQGVENVDPSVVVDVPEDRRRRCLGPRNAARCFEDDIQGSHGGHHLEGRVHVGGQPLSRDGQSIGSFRLGELLARDRWTAGDPNRHSRLPVDQHHATGQTPALSHQAVEVDPGGHGAPICIRGPPGRGVKAGRTLALHQRGDALAEDVEDLQPHEHCRRQLVGNDRGRIEGVGVVRPQVEPLRHRPPRKRLR